MNIRKELEALLFVYGEPLEIKKIASLLEVTEEIVKTNLEELKNELTNENRGIAIMENGDSVQLATKPSVRNVVEKVLASEFEETLTTPAQETLSVIAYAGPATRSEIDYIRGVNSSFTIRSLLLRGLIERAEEKNEKTHRYQITMSFLKHLNLLNIGDLPDYEKARQMIGEFRKIKDSVE